ncbi:PucR family transcriptional regulator [Luedemannella flava]
MLPIEQARDTRFRYGADGVVVERERDAVLLLRDGPRARRDQLADALHGRGAVVGPMLDWARAPEAVRLAELAAGLVGRDPAGPHAAGAVVFADDHLAALALGGEISALAVLAQRRLAPLSGLRPNQRESLLVTLHSWLRHWGSRADVAAELFVHPQTVSYRLKRLRELLGDDLDEPSARFELLLVLTARRVGPS